MDSMYGLFAVLGGFIIVFAIIGVVLYVLKSIGLYKLAVNDGIENPWLAWIPIADLYLMAKIAKDVYIGNWRIPNNEIILPVAFLLLMFISEVPVIGILLKIAGLIVYFFTLHKLYKNYRPDSAVLWIVLSIIFSFMIPIFLFIMRDDKLAFRD